MDDPWANAWGEPMKPDAGSLTTWAPSITPSPTNDVQDSETDIAMPSWATGAGAKWAEPSDAQDSLWNATLPSKEWAASPYDSISLAKGSVDEFAQPSDSPSPEPAEPSHLSTPSPPAPPFQSVENEPPEDNATISQPSSPTVSSTKSVSLPGSPDAFGTFETGLDNDEPNTDPWSHPGAVPDPASLDADAWGGPEWGASSSEVEVYNKPADEWEEAKQQKERQDRHVPPQVLASILHQFEGLSLELWPKPTETPAQGLDSGSQNWQNGMDGVESLTSVVENFIPQDLILPPYVQFPKTFTSKHMGESLRLTRHVATTRSSPMAIYLASKGSTAWETSVKSRPEVLKDDLLPPGWRVIEKEKDVTSPAADAKKKASGGLLSFFGRRGGPASPPAAGSSRSASPVRPPSSASMVVASSSVGIGAARASMDSSSVPTRSTTPVALSSPVRVSTTNLTTSSESFPSAPASSIPSAPPPPPPQDIFEPTPPTSAVSRFLTRFSRSKTAGSSPRNSLALSTDDLEFLSDIIPSANDEVDEASQLKELSSMIGSSPLPTKLPPPLPPPPRLLPPTRASSNNSTSNVQNVVEPPRINNDFLSLFDSPVTHLAGTLVDSEPQSLSFAKPSTNTQIANPSSPTTPIVDESLFQAASSPSMSQFSSPFDVPPASAPASRTRTPLPQKRTPVAIMSTSSTATPPPNTLFAFLPPPPSSRAPPPILPPPLNIGVTTSRPLTQVPLPSRKSQETSSNEATIFESVGDDDFSDFHSTPVVATMSFDSSVSSVFSDKSLITTSSASTSSTKDHFDDFDDFVSSPLRTPSPPRPPAKPISFGHRPLQQPPPLRSTSPTKPQPHPPRRVSRAADHQRTMSLLDIAATRQGRWPAPPSPLPNVLPPPPGNTTSSAFDIFNEDSTMQGQPMTAVASLGPSVSSPAAFPGSDTTPRLSNFPPPLGFAMSPPPQHRALSPPITTPQNGNAKPTSLRALPISPTTTPGGLSAQDLSFFEGL